MRNVAIAVALVLTVSTCSGSSPGETGEADAGAEVPQAADRHRPVEVGSITGAPTAFLEELRAFARDRTQPLPAGAILHDDSQTLWLVAAAGQREALFTHISLAITSLAVSEDGSRVALTAWFAPDSSTVPSAALYVANLGDSAELVDAVKHYGHIGSPTFLRPPSASSTGGGAAERADEELYWLRSWVEYDSDTQRIPTHVVRWSDRERSIVEVSLRHGESITRIDGYPGSEHFTITLVRRLGGDPSDYEALVNHDTGVGGRSVNVWSIFTTRGNTDANLNVAWLTAGRFAVPMHDQGSETVTFDLWRVYCGHVGPLSIGPFDVDWGLGDPWRVLALGDEQVLVLRGTDLDNFRADERTTVYWHAIDTAAGTVSPTPIRWGPGAWTVVREPPTEVARPDDC